MSFPIDTHNNEAISVIMFFNKTTQTWMTSTMPKDSLVIYDQTLEVGDGVKEDDTITYKVTLTYKLRTVTVQP